MTRRRPENLKQQGRGLAEVHGNRISERNHGASRACTDSRHFRPDGLGLDRAGPIVLDNRWTTTRSAACCARCALSSALGRTRRLTNGEHQRTANGRGIALKGRDSDVAAVLDLAHLGPRRPHPLRHRDPAQLALLSDLGQSSRKAPPVVSSLDLPRKVRVARDRRGDNLLQEVGGHGTTIYRDISVGARPKTQRCHRASFGVA